MHENCTKDHKFQEHKLKVSYDWHDATSLVHPDVHIVTFCSITPSLIFQNLKKHMCLVLISLHIITNPSIHHRFGLQNNPPKYSNHMLAHTHHLVIIAMLTLRYSIMSHTTLVLNYHGEGSLLQTTWHRRLHRSNSDYNETQDLR